MTYYPTLAEDLKLAKEILAKGREDYPVPGSESTTKDGKPYVITGCSIYPVDTYAAYKLLESFVEVIEHDQAGIQRIRVLLEKMLGHAEDQIPG